MVIVLVVKINYERARLIAEALKPYRDQILSLYLKDPQYIAINNLVKARGCAEASLLVLLNSVVSYNLKVKGEDYWLSFAEYFSHRKNNVDYLTFRDFLTWSKNTLLLEQKLERVKKILGSPLVPKLYVNPLEYCSNVSRLVDDLSKILGSTRESKTVVFAAKMYGYLCYACGQEADYTSISIPVDFRNAVLSLTSCIVSECDEDLYRCASELVQSRNASVVREAWSIVCSEIAIPCLHLDTFTWLITRSILEEKFDVQRALVDISGKHGIKISANLLKLLVECAPRYV
ncbi:MAG: N-glycosylase/DNA lyase [Desulfurococcaceae archaeon]